MSYLEELNERQREAVYQTEGPLLILAGAGSGKTKVVTSKIAYLIEHLNVFPSKILAFTFTNKAAGEMRDRVEKLLMTDASKMWIGTFHSICVRILRMNIDIIGFSKNFTIYDTHDQVTLLKDIIKRRNLNGEMFKPKAIISKISSLKNEGVSPKEFLKENGENFYDKILSEIYEDYNSSLKTNNALDFDDLIIKTVELLRDSIEVRNYYREKFDYIFVDEYQDTNKMQYLLIRYLSRENPNLTLVGDNDQSIYKWRGADISNILNFEKDYKDAKVILLEQNYRSTGNILRAANSVIKNNPDRYKKNLWTSQEDGKDVEYERYEHSIEEDRGVVNKIEQLNYKGRSFDEFAILYRTNAQSRGFEDMLMREGIPYKIIGGLRFYDRKEVKDILAYLRLLVNENDDVSLKRIINTPKRGIGLTSLEKLEEAALRENISILKVIEDADKYDFGKNKKINDFKEIIENLKDKALNLDLPSLIEGVIIDSGYLSDLQKDKSLESRTRIENLEEFVSAAKDFEKEVEGASLEEFLAMVSLLSDVDKTDEKSGVKLMTVHAAKGLEFPVVFLVGMEENIFPSFMSMEEDEDVEEERRLCYVAITRAEEELYISSAKARNRFGNTQFNRESRFIDEMGDIKKISCEEKNNVEVIDFTKTNKDKGEDLLRAPIWKSQKPEMSKENKNINIGDKVRHKTFGQGMIVAKTKKGNDYEVVISFDKGGIKRLMLSFAPLELIK